MWILILFLILPVSTSFAKGVTKIDDNSFSVIDNVVVSDLKGKISVIEKQENDWGKTIIDLQNRININEDIRRILQNQINDAADAGVSDAIPLAKPREDSVAISNSDNL